MKPKQQKTVPFKVYKLLAEQIENNTNGLDYHEGEAEVVHNNLTYVIRYSIRRESDLEMITDYDSENVYSEKAFVSISDMTIYNATGDTVTMTMDTDEITKYFDAEPCYTDED